MKWNQNQTKRNKNNNEVTNLFHTFFDFHIDRAENSISHDIADHNWPAAFPNVILE